MISEKNIILSNGRDVILQKNGKNRKYIKAEWNKNFTRIEKQLPITIGQKKEYEILWKRLEDVVTLK